MTDTGDHERGCSAAYIVPGRQEDGGGAHPCTLAKGHDGGHVARDGRGRDAFALRPTHDDRRAWDSGHSGSFEGASDG